MECRYLGGLRHYRSHRARYSGLSWQSSWQTSGTYSHEVSGVTLAGSFSQSNSTTDTSSYANSGSAASNASGVYTWTPSGTGTDTLTTSSSDDFSGSGLAANSWQGFTSEGTQSESASASSYVSQTTG
jgi:hypothetical protein